MIPWTKDQWRRRRHSSSFTAYLSSSHLARHFKLNLRNSTVILTNSQCKRIWCHQNDIKSAARYWLLNHWPRKPGQWIINRNAHSNFVLVKCVIAWIALPSREFIRSPEPRWQPPRLSKIIIICLKKSLDSDWLKAVRFKCNTDKKGQGQSKLHIVIGPALCRIQSHGTE